MLLKSRTSTGGIGAPTAVDNLETAAVDGADPVGPIATDLAVLRSTCPPAYWDDACTHLAGCDRVIRKLIPSCGEARLSGSGDAFTTLARSIVCWQIGEKSGRAHWRKIKALLEPSAMGLAPAAVLALDAAAMKRAGLSKRKIDHLYDLAGHFVTGSVEVAKWQAMEDEAVVEELLAIRGICRWNAEMFLIHHLMRPDVLPLDDPGLRNGISLNYFSGEPVSRAEAREVGNAWAPYRSVATWYIWQSSSPLPLD